MRIQFLGHASFLITTSAGTKILTDPYDPQSYPGVLTYRPYEDYADIITMSHEHGDHSARKYVKGTPVLIKGAGKFGADEVEILGIETYHDDVQGSLRGRNTIFIITADGMRIAHLGDLGHVLTSDQAAEIGDVDIAMIPVGGNFTIDAAKATRVADQIAANIIIPMHYATSKCKFQIAGVDEFLKNKDNVVVPGKSALEVTANTLPRSMQIIVLEPAL